MDYELARKLLDDFLTVLVITTFLECLFLFPSNFDKLPTISFQINILPTVKSDNKYNTIKLGVYKT